jgi:hypothetical protein
MVFIFINGSSLNYIDKTQFIKINDFSKSFKLFIFLTKIVKTFFLLIFLKFYFDYVEKMKVFKNKVN